MCDPSLDTSKLFRVLVADDSTEIRDILFEALSLMECIVTCVKDGKEALVILQADSYDLLITDYQMPHLNGLDLLRCLQDESRCLPSILITGHNSPGLIEEAQQAGALHVVAKPFAIPHFLSLVETIRSQ